MCLFYRLVAFVPSFSSFLIGITFVVDFIVWESVSLLFMIVGVWLCVCFVVCIICVGVFF